jgi:hypothetical protein
VEKESYFLVLMMSLHSHCSKGELVVVAAAAAAAEDEEDKMVVAKKRRSVQHRHSSLRFSRPSQKPAVL